MLSGHVGLSRIVQAVWVALMTTTALTGVAIPRAIADTLEDALVLAYQNNPQINSQRAATRATDEGVGIALSGYRPKVTASAQTGEQYLDLLSKQSIGNGYSRSVGAIAVTSFGVTASQTLFNGFQTASRTRQAEGQVFAQREILRTTEQAILLNAVGAYMNLSRDAALLELQRNNVKVLEATLRQTRDRFGAGEVTRTDLAQAESSFAAGRSASHAAESNYVTSKSAYIQVIGVEPAKLANASAVDRFSPPPLAAGLRRGGG